MTTEPDDSLALPIAAVAQRTGLSAHTLRYYEKAGLVEAVGRNPGGQRRYASADLDWLSFLLRLRTTGMSISDMQRFAELRRSGPSTVPKRLKLLREHAEAVQAHIQELQTNLRDLNAKIDHYEELLLTNPGQESTSPSRPAPSDTMGQQWEPLVSAAWA